MAGEGHRRQRAQRLHDRAPALNGHADPSPSLSIRATERELLHRGGRTGTWGNLGLWSSDADDDYATANAALARAVAHAADVRAGQRVLAVACGAGDELTLLRREFGVIDVLGLEADAALVTATEPVRIGPAVDGLRTLAAAIAARREPAFDAVLCIDAAYHLVPRAAFLGAAHGCLVPGGRIAFTDLVAAPRGMVSRLAIRAAARASGLDGAELVDTGAAVQRLAAAGFEKVRAERLDDAVLGGFERFVARQAARLGAEASGPGWRRPAAVARAWPALRRAGLGYALFAAVAR